MTPSMPAENAGGQPVSLLSPRTKAMPRVLHPGCGDVEYGEVAEAAIQQRPGERGCAAAHVDDGISGRDPGRAEHPKRHARMLLEPAPRVIAQGVGGVPVRGCCCLIRHLLILRAARAGQLAQAHHDREAQMRQDRKSTRLNSSHPSISYAVFCLKKKKKIKK